MEKYNRLLFAIWRESCRHINMSELVGRLMVLLSDHIPLDSVQVYGFAEGRTWVERLAYLGVPPAPDLIQWTPNHVRNLLRWCQTEGATPCGPQTVSKGIFADMRQDTGLYMLLIPVVSEHGTTGLFVLGNSHRAYQEHEVKLADLLREPFAAALENDRRLNELRTLREALEADKRKLLNRLGREHLTEEVVGADAGLQSVMKRVQLVSRSDVPVLILGETGSGKEVIARAIHERSPRSTGPFIRVNCGAIPSELIDSELFGHERGSFTGAVADRKGWFERAESGTLFLDEIAELSHGAQVRLLRVLQDGTFERVGGGKELRANVRIVAATHRDLAKMIQEHAFREDLWYRIAVFPIVLPPLRERKQDIPALVRHFVKNAARRFGLKEQQFAVRFQIGRAHV